MIQPAIVKISQKSDSIKYFNAMQILLLRNEARNRCILAETKNQQTAIREWAVIDLLTATEMRVSEIVDLRCGDIKGGFSSEIFVRSKGNKSRTIKVQKCLIAHLQKFMIWKQEMGESVSKEDFVFIGQRGPWTNQGIQQIVKKYLKNLGLYEKGKSVHAIRLSSGIWQRVHSR